MRPRRLRRPSPCPACDAELDAGRVEAGACPECGQRLLAVSVAGFWSRSASLAIDAAILVVTAGPLHWGLTRVVPVPDLAPGSSGIDALLQAVTADAGMLLARFAPFLIMSALYFLLFWTLSGRTLGQAALHLRVIDRTGARPRPAATAVRLLAAGAGSLAGALGLLWTAFDAEKRAFHDHVAGTYVVREP